jgi:hypothetical protein
LLPAPHPVEDRGAYGGANAVGAEAIGGEMVREPVELWAYGERAETGDVDCEVVVVEHALSVFPARER